LINAYTESNLDIHRLTASEVFEVEYSDVSDEQRSIAKSINFGLIYGKTAYGLSPDLTRITGQTYNVEQAQEVIDTYFKKLPKVKQCLEQFINQADATGQATTLYERKRPIPQLASNKTSERQAGKRVAMNTPIQGTAADILKIAMIKCSEAIKTQKLKSQMVLTVHDELLFEVPKDETKIMEILVKREMENAVKLTVPLKVDLQTGANWAEVH
jgi:DNA polymerase-1